QFQNYQAYNEWNFTCLGIDPLKMDISKSSPTSGATPKKASKPKLKSLRASINVKDVRQVTKHKQKVSFVRLTVKVQHEEDIQVEHLEILSVMTCLMVV